MKTRDEILEMLSISHGHTQTIIDAANVAHELVNELWQQEPQHETFEQSGLLDGRATVLDFLRHGEWGQALEHLLYMIHESAIDFPSGTVGELHQLAEKYDVPNSYNGHADIIVKSEEKT